MTDLKNIVESWANNVFITHDDVTKCGQCWREKIRSEVSKEFLSSRTEFNIETIKEIEKEIKTRWKNTSLYSKVHDLMSNGKDLNEIARQLEQEGIEI